MAVEVKDKVVTVESAKLLYDTLTAYTNNNFARATDMNNKLATKQNLHYYYDPTEFGCTKASTIATVVNALPDNSVFICYAGNLTDASWNFPTTLSILRIEKVNGGTVIRLFGAYSEEEYRGSTTGTWVRIDAVRLHASAKGSARSLSLTANTITQLTLDTWVANSDEAFTFSDDGIKVPVNGDVLVSGSVYMAGASSSTTAVYVYKNGVEVASAKAYGLNAGAAGMSPVIIPVVAGDVLTLRARDWAGGSCTPNAKVTHLDVVYL